MRRICQVGLFIALLIAGCSKTKQKTVVVIGDSDKSKPREIIIQTDRKAADPGKTAIQPGPGTPRTVDPPLSLRRDRYEAAVIEALDFLAVRDYPKVLACFEKAQAQGIDDGGFARREVDRFRAVLDQQASAKRAAEDIHSILDDGRADEAYTLARRALRDHGDGDRAGDLVKLEQQAGAIISASADAATRQAALAAEARQALGGGDLRSAAVALELAIALRADDNLSRQLGEVRDLLRTYDDNRGLADALRRDPARLEEALTYLRKAQGVWKTLQVRQEIDEFTLLLERRRDRIGVADFEVVGDVGSVAAGREVADTLLPLFKPRFVPVERSQINRVLDEVKLQSSDLRECAAQREVGRLARVRYLVVGSITPVGGVTVHARLIEAGSGLVVQTARATAPTLEALLPQLPEVARVLQLSDQQKLAEEAKLVRSAPPPPPIEPTPIDVVPPPPAETGPAPAPIVTWSPSPPPMQNLVIQDFAALDNPPPATVVIIRGQRRNRLLRLSLSLGDNLFRRGQYRDAERHYSLAFSLAGPRREITLRLSTCRRFIPPPPPRLIVAPPRRLTVGPATLVINAPRLVVAPPPRPRLAVFGFYSAGNPGLVPAAMGEWAADSIAPYLGDNYELIDRGEVCWYMGRLGLTMRELLRDAEARLCLARALNARFLVFGTIQPVASFSVQTHLVDAETGVRVSGGSIHMQGTDDLKLRISELAFQMGAGSAAQKTMANQSAAVEKAVNDSRKLLKDDAKKAADTARAALKQAPNNVALLALVAEAEQKQRLAAFEAARRNEAAKNVLALQQARQHQQEWLQQAALVRTRADGEARARSAAARDELRQQRDRAAERLLQQAKQASSRGDYAQAVSLLQSAAGLSPGEAVYSELGQARAAATKARDDAARAAQQTRDKARQAQAEKALQRVLAERKARSDAEASARKVQQMRDQIAHGLFVKQAETLLAKRDFERALAAAQSARKINATPRTAEMIQQAHDGLALAEAEKKGAEAKRKAQEELKQRQADLIQAQKNQTAYLTALEAGQKAVQTGRYDEAITQYNAALKLFRTDVAQSGLNTAQELRKRQIESQTIAANTAKQVKDLLAKGGKALAANDHVKAIDLYRQAIRLAPGNAEAQAGLSRAEQEQAAHQARISAAARDKERQKAFQGLMSTAKTAISKNRKADAAKMLRQALDLYPDNAEAKKLLANVDQVEADYQLAMGAGQSALKVRNYLGAVNSYNAALQKKPNDAAALAARKEAQRLLDDAYQSSMKQGQMWMAAKKPLDAMKAYDEALKLKPGDQTATKARATAEAALKPPAPALDPKMVAYDKWMKQGQAEMNAGKFADAVKAYDEALKVKPGDAAAINGKKAAQDKLKPPPAPAPKQPAAYDNWMKQGQTALTRKQWATAIKAFDEALKVKPGDAEAIKGKKAADDGQKAEEARQRDAAYQGWMKQGQAAMQAKKYADALKAYDEALKQKPGDQAAINGKKAAQDALTPKPDPKQAAYDNWMKQGQVALTAKKWADALKAFDEALKIRPGDPAASKGKKTAADAAKPPPPPPVNPQAEYTKAMQQGAALEKQKKYAEAATAYRTALKWVPGDPGTNAALKTTQGQAWLGVGRNEHAAKRYGEAVKAYEEVLKRIPNQPEAKAALPRAKANKP
jgi:tetratricopeptide (TPR) repeat protein